MPKKTHRYTVEYAAGVVNAASGETPTKLAESLTRALRDSMTSVTDVDLTARLADVEWSEPTSGRVYLLATLTSELGPDRFGAVLRETRALSIYGASEYGMWRGLAKFGGPTLCHDGRQLSLSDKVICAHVWAPDGAPRRFEIGDKEYERSYFRCDLCAAPAFRNRALIAL